MSLISEARAQFHEQLKAKLWRLDKYGYPSNADKPSKKKAEEQPDALPTNTSTDIAKHLAGQFSVVPGPTLPAQSAGAQFENAVADFIQSTFLKFTGLRPGDWDIERVTARTGLPIAKFEQYRYIGDVEKAAKSSPEIRVLLGENYNIASDVVIARRPVNDEIINAEAAMVDDVSALHSVLRKRSGALPTLHACISCKWTLRSDRAQNARSEALNLIRNRRGRAPHIVVVTAEPLPSRISSLALGTGDIDCVYHIALPELRAAAAATHAKSSDLLELMYAQNRIKDISDLPLDLAI
ncbi:MAG: hypothetical protein J7499_06860 [Sphingopyxis sp.]|nr:hypothetical protein [Sphingopyxis sp.]